MVTRTSPGCDLPPAIWRVTIRGGQISSGLGQQARVDVAGNFVLDVRSSDGARVITFAGRLQGDEGRGESVAGASCKSLLEFKRASVPERQAAVATTAQDPGPASSDFDGVWAVSLTGGEWCMVKTNQFQLEIKGGAILRSAPLPGRVDVTGRFVFYRVSASNKEAVVPYRGQLGKTEGRGTYDIAKCSGTLEFKRQ
jgi:hypothetical protein